MKIEAGIWIDHGRAYIMILNNKRDEYRQIINNKEIENRYSGGSRDWPSEDRQDRKYIEQLNRYYDEVIECVSNANSILIFGPGEAKTEFKKRLENVGFGDRVVGVETCGKLTEPQIAVKIRQKFLA